MVLQKAIHSLFGTFSRQLLSVLQRPFKNHLKYALKYPLFNFIPTALFTMTPSSFQHGLVEEIKNTLTLQTSPLNPRRLCSRHMENLYTSLLKWQIAKEEQEYSVWLSRLPQKLILPSIKTIVLFIRSALNQVTGFVLTDRLLLF